MAQPESPPQLITGLPGKYVITPPFLDRLTAILARWPWWAIITVAGLVVAVYSLISIPLYHRALIFVTGDPKLTTDRIANVAYTVKDSEGKTAQVSGILTGDDASTVTVITQDEVRLTVPRSDMTGVSCAGANVLDGCPANSKVTFTRTSVSGALIFEGLGSYTINTPFQQEEIFVIGMDKTATTRKPEGCSADPNGNCFVTVKFKPDADQSHVTGTLLSTEPDSIVVQMTPPITTTIKKPDIISTDNYVPAQCAVNNLGACRVGIFLTLWTTLAAFALALLLGLAFGLMRVSANPVLYNISTLYVEVIRGIPLLVILLFAGFVIEPWYHDNFASIGPTVAVVVGVAAVLIILGYTVSRGKQLKVDPAFVLQPIILTAILGAALVGIVLILAANRVQDTFLRAVISGVVGLAIGYGAYLAELFRAGIQSIGKGQMEAARSLGMTYVQAMRYIILPQAFRVILPPLGNDFIAMLKDTSLIAILAVPELTQQARIFASKTYQPFPTYITIAVLYLGMTLFLSLFVRVIERRMHYHH